MYVEHEIYAINIVFRGNFNPAIVNPMWLALKKIIRESEATSAKINVIHPEISSFELDWCEIQITSDRFDFKTKRESDFELLRDLIVSIFTHLSETPISAVGINHLCHYTLNDYDQYKKLGFWLSAVEQFSSFLNEPRLESIQFTETVDQNKNSGVFRIKIAPSDLITNNKSVVINVNNHFDNLKKLKTREFIEEFVKNWKNSFAQTKNINDSIWKIAKI